MEDIRFQLISKPSLPFYTVPQKRQGYKPKSRTSSLLYISRRFSEKLTVARVFPSISSSQENVLERCQGNDYKNAYRVEYKGEDDKLPPFYF